MPNAKVLSEKQAIVESLSEKLKNAAAGLIVDYKGITVAEDTALRKACRENEVEYAVVKNTLLRRAFDNTGLGELDEHLNGTTSLAIASDPVAPARIIAEYAKKLENKFEIKGGFMDGKVIDMATINSLASIPALPVLQAQVLGTMLAKKFRADGMIYEQMKFCDYWGFERALVSHIMNEEYGWPVLSIDRPYNARTSGQLRTRFQAFVESLEIKRIHQTEGVANHG